MHASAIGSALAESLPVFSLDLVGLVSSYLVCGVATEGALFTSVCTIGTQGSGDGAFDGNCYGIAISSNNTIFVSCALVSSASHTDSRVQAFNEEGKFLFRVAVNFKWPACVACDTNGELYIASF